MKDFDIFGRLVDAGRSLGAVGKGVALWCMMLRLG